MVTTIQVEEILKEKLDKLKIHHRETYNELITRLIESNSPKNSDRETLVETLEIISNPETMRNIAQALEEYERGNGVEFSKIKKELNLDV